MSGRRNRRGGSRRSSYSIRARPSRDGTHHWITLSDTRRGTVVEMEVETDEDTEAVKAYIEGLLSEDYLGSLSENALVSEIVPQISDLPWVDSVKVEEP